MVSVGPAYPLAAHHSEVHLTWQANNVRGQWKRAFVSALNVFFAGCGGIMGGTVFRGQDSPTYLPGLITCMICDVLIVVITASIAGYFAWCNKKPNEGKMVIEGLEWFRYTL
ncbi:uncharacterized protein A1O9_00373 [Exophiala aquamarina CBS 119918]|uniref:Uncharacterized protein n=1 Tax=Exophiala aquamarina CBS 119918 TaxID=1182545 RepID=A0A072PRA5_9EURO|nr:uncharacterized protein A1O9_00373 [Exophiala aquamarina CBS 119918]KEF62401.1 hypothetical protein A1O9_00373 [Exophiala aquamarina CBS 119918]